MSRVARKLEHISILEALAEPALLGSALVGDPASWSAWLTFLASFFGLPLSETGLALYRDCTARHTSPAAPFSTVYLICGRGAGKSFMLSLVAVYLACFRDWTSKLAPVGLPNEGASQDQLELYRRHFGRQPDAAAPCNERNKQRRYVAHRRHDRNRRRELSINSRPFRVLRLDRRGGLPEVRNQRQSRCRADECHHAELGQVRHRWDFAGRQHAFRPSAAFFMRGSVPITALMTARHYAGCRRRG